MSTDLKTTYVRCSDCGARSQVPARDSREAVIAR
jgi:DNA-directed RNA polymerase subunit RPC12/RpoP